MEKKVQGSASLLKVRCHSFSSLLWQRSWQGSVGGGNARPILTFLYYATFRCEVLCAFFQRPSSDPQGKGDGWERLHGGCPVPLTWVPLPYLRGHHCWLGPPFPVVGGCPNPWVCYGDGLVGFGVAPLSWGMLKTQWLASLYVAIGFLGQAGQED